MRAHRSGVSRRACHMLPCRLNQTMRLAPWLRTSAWAGQPRRLYSLYAASMAALTSGAYGVNCFLSKSDIHAHVAWRTLVASDEALTGADAADHAIWVVGPTTKGCFVCSASVPGEDAVCCCNAPALGRLPPTELRRMLHRLPIRLSSR